eukprot:TRINITY_DN9245_c1_g1_i1.p1 TRINITY_DN9245_c1_g1~~TRINITY_DN9245_c1_g1_i1.p1  ORF type:complete len:237 (+),score=-25.10 TRINITY_DN9245_c1_g1_i1:40-750(+)
MFFQIILFTYQNSHHLDQFQTFSRSKHQKNQIKTLNRLVLSDLPPTQFDTILINYEKYPTTKYPTTNILPFYLSIMNITSLTIIIIIIIINYVYSQLRFRSETAQKQNNLIVLKLIFIYIYSWKLQETIYISVLLRRIVHASQKIGLQIIKTKAVYRKILSTLSAKTYIQQNQMITSSRNIYLIQNFTKISISIYKYIETQETLKFGLIILPTQNTLKCVQAIICFQFEKNRLQKL